MNFINCTENYLMAGAIVVLKNSASNLKLTYHHTYHMSVTGRQERVEPDLPIDKMSVTAGWQASSRTERTALAKERQSLDMLFFA